jgi:hypothetical protein
VVETGGLENRCAGNRTGGSNPSPSAMQSELTCAAQLATYTSNNCHHIFPTEREYTGSRQRKSACPLKVGSCIKLRRWRCRAEPKEDEESDLGRTLVAAEARGIQIIAGAKTRGCMRPGFAQALDGRRRPSPHELVLTRARSRSPKRRLRLSFRSPSG